MWSLGPFSGTLPSIYSWRGWCGFNPDLKKHVDANLGSLFSTSFWCSKTQIAGPILRDGCHFLAHEANPSFDIYQVSAPKNPNVPKNPFTLPIRVVFSGIQLPSSGYLRIVLDLLGCVFFCKKISELPVYEYVDRHQHHLVGPWLAMLMESVNVLEPGVPKLSKT